MRESVLGTERDTAIKSSIRTQFLHILQSDIKTSRPDFLLMSRPNGTCYSSEEIRSYPKDRLFLEKDQNNRIHYKILDDNNEIIDDTISLEQLPGVTSEQLDNNKIESFKKIEKSILAITSKKGHTKDTHYLSGNICEYSVLSTKEKSTDSSENDWHFNSLQHKSIQQAFDTVSQELKDLGFKVQSTDVCSLHNYYLSQLDLPRSVEFLVNVTLGSEEEHKKSEETNKKIAEFGKTMGERKSLSAAEIYSIYRSNGGGLLASLFIFGFYNFKKVAEIQSTLEKRAPKNPYGASWVVSHSLFLPKCDVASEPNKLSSSVTPYSKLKCNAANLRESTFIHPL